MSSKSSNKRASSTAIEAAASKRQARQTTKPSATATSAVQTEQVHTYPTVEFSDMVVKLCKGSTVHKYLVHRQTLSTACIYFATDAIMHSTTKVTVDIPPSFPGTASELAQWLDICYGKYDKMLHTLAQAPTNKAFAALLITKGKTFDHNTWNAELEPEYWTALEHTEDGVTLLRRISDGLEVGYLPDCLKIGPTDSLFEELTEVMDLLTMLRLTCYFGHHKLKGVLTTIVLKFVAIADSECALLKAVAALLDELGIPELRKACLTRIDEIFEDDPAQVENLLALPPAIMLDLYRAKKSKENAQIEIQRATHVNQSAGSQSPPSYDAVHAAPGSRSI